MKIIDVADHYSDQGGGVKTYILSKIKAAQQMGHEMIVVAPGTNERIEYKHGGKIIWTNSRRLLFDKRYGVFSDPIKIYNILDHEQPDIVEVGSIGAGARIVADWKGGARKVLIFHQDFVAAYGHTFLDSFMSRSAVDRIFYPLWSYIRHLSQSYDITVTAGEWLKIRLDSFGIKNPISVPFGIDKKDFSAHKYDDELRDELLSHCGMPHTAKLAITVSRFHPEKRLKTLIDAVKLVNRDAEVGHVIFGDGLFSRQLRSYGSRIKGVHFGGYTQDREFLSRAYASSDVLLHGSAAETYGISVAEGICSGLPIVVPDVGGASDFLKCENGISYTTGDAMSCANAIKTVISKPRKNWIYSSNAQQLLIRSKEQHFESLFNHYLSLIGVKSDFGAVIN